MLVFFTYSEIYSNSCLTLSKLKNSIWFLDGVLEEFIQKAKGLRGFENSVRSAQKGRALGLGVLGWHTYLQEKFIPFEGLLAQFETRKIFSQINFSPYTFDCLEKIVELPFTDKNLLRSHKDELINKNISKSKLFYMTTGETSGV